jgi:hypothetical protein
VKLKGGGYETRVTLTLPLDGWGKKGAQLKGAGAMNRAKRQPPWSWSERYSGNDVAQLSKKEMATKIAQWLQSLNEGGLVLGDEELVNGLTRLMERTERREGDGVGAEEAWRLAIAEQLYDEYPHPQWLLKLAAFTLQLQYEPKFKAERKQEEAERKRKQEHQLECITIDCWAEMLRDQGVRDYRHKAMLMYADWMGITVGALKQRRRRERRRRERRKRGVHFSENF